MLARERTPIYEMSINLRVSWQAHSLSNAGSNGSNRLLPRRQLLSDGTETDACSGNIAKHYHATLAAEYMQAIGVPLCAACAARDGRRAAALVGGSEGQAVAIGLILQQCGLCDTHGFLITGKNAASDGSTEARQKVSKHSLLEFPFALALAERHAESSQLLTRVGASKDDGQMLIKMPCRSGVYAFGVRYKCAGIGVDTDKWQVVLSDEKQRCDRHVAVLSALRDQMISPSGAVTSTMLPHLTGLVGAITLRPSVGRAPMYSALQDDFIVKLASLQGSACQVFAFDGIDTFCQIMENLIESSYPFLPHAV